MRKDLWWAKSWNVITGCSPKSEGCTNCWARRMANFISIGTGWRGQMPHVYLGVTAENQQRADERIPILLQIPAAKRFVSIEPMLGPVDLRRIKNRGDEIDCLGGYVDENDGDGCFRRQCEELDWIIVGGESGPGARPMHPNWPRVIRYQCQQADVPYFFKQWGEWIDWDDMPEPKVKRINKLAENKIHSWRGKGDPDLSPAGRVSYRIGKKEAGRFLDGREWNQMP